MEFKGTKGKWVITYPEGSNGFIYVGEKTNEGNIATCYTVDSSEWDQNITEETKANALLISKAPELLNALIRLLELTKEMDKTILDIEKLSYADPKFLEEIQNIIKETTEIN